MWVFLLKACLVLRWQDFMGNKDSRHQRMAAMSILVGSNQRWSLSKPELLTNFQIQDID